MNAIDNSALLNIDKPLVDTTGFAPAMTFAYNAGAKTVTVTDASAFGAGDSFSRINVKIHDEVGNTVLGTISAAAGNTGALDVSGMDLTTDLAITATMNTTKGCMTAGSVRGVNATKTSGSLGKWTVGQFSTATGS